MCNVFPESTCPNVKPFAKLKQRFEQIVSTKWMKKGRIKQVINKEIQILLAAAAVQDTDVSTRTLTNNVEIIRTSVLRILHKNKFYLYLVQLIQETS